MDAWGITDGYYSVRGDWRPTSDEVRAALHEAMGAEGDAPPERPSLTVVAGDEHHLEQPGEVRLEDGTELGWRDTLPPDLPVGYHVLAPADGAPPVRLLARPGSTPEAPHAWGWAVQLYSLLSRHSWGIGDLGDLRDLARWTSQVGGGVVQVSPLHASAPLPGAPPSPYYAGTRRFRSIWHVRATEIPGASPDVVLDDLDQAGRELDALAIIDRNAVVSLKMRALRRVYDAAPPPEAFHAWRSRQPATLDLWGVYCLLAMQHGMTWMAWPAELRHPEHRDVQALRDHPDVAFHAWCQWVLDTQLDDASRQGVALVGDLAVGFDPGGFDGWLDQDALALGCRVGAPPDEFAPGGQDWGFPPYVPWKLRELGYGPFIETIRAVAPHMGGLRLDHAMALSRLYWIPPEGDASHGAYVRQAGTELFDVLAIEAHRAGTFVVCEDLGTVEDAVKEALAERGFLGTVVSIFEPRPGSEYRADALAVLTTHDLPTVAGLVTGADMAMVRAADRRKVDDRGLRRNLALLAPEARTVDEMIVGTHRSLTHSPSRLVLGTLDDAVATVRRPNLPGTVDEYPNWRIPLPVPLEDLPEHPSVRRVTAALAERSTNGDG